MKKDQTVVILALVLISFSYYSSYISKTGLVTNVPSSVTVVSSSPNCGDLICDAGEDCTTCPIDCGICGATNSSYSGGSLGGGGGGGAGGSVSRIIVDLDKNNAETINVGEEWGIILIYNKNQYDIQVIRVDPSSSSFRSDFVNSFVLVTGSEQRFDIAGNSDKDIAIKSEEYNQNKVTLTFRRLASLIGPTWKTGQKEAQQETVVQEPAQILPAVKDSHKLIWVLIVLVLIAIGIAVFWWFYHKNKIVKPK